MADQIDSHYITPSDGTDDELVTRRRWVASNFALSRGSWLMMSSIATLSVFTLTLYSTRTFESTNLFSLVGLKNGVAISPTPLYSSKDTQLRGFLVVPKATKTGFEKGEKVEYYSPSNGRWITCTVTQVRKDGSVQIDAKKGQWFDEASGSLKKIKASPFSFFGGGSKSQGVEDKLGRPEDFDPNSKAYAYAMAREQRRQFAERERRAREAESQGGLAGLFGSVVGALDFQENIKEDQKLLRSAKQLRKGEKMTRDEYGALQRKVGGTKDGFFGDFVDVEGDYVDKGWIDWGGKSSKPQKTVVPAASQAPLVQDGTGLVIGLSLIGIIGLSLAVYQFAQNNA